MSSSLIFIPDISGFTHFVNNTEIEHAEHIISELLEIIIDSNELDLKVAEIEGDAVLFYREGDAPTFEQLYEQSRKIFINFHTHLQRYEVERVCQCGACSSASTLSLKFITHYGEIGFTKVKNSAKPFGPNLVLSHRLLKNDLEEKEYLLFTDTLRGKEGYSAGGEEYELHEKVLNYPDTGEVKVCYINLRHARASIPEPIPPKAPEKIKNPITWSIEIKKPLFYVFEMVTNLDLRLTWNLKVRKLEYDQGKMNRIGTKHRCLFNSGFADFETIKDDFGSDTLVYGEKLTKVPGMDYVATYHLLNQTDKGTLVRVEAHYKVKKPFGYFVLPILRHILKKGFKESLAALKDVCEKNDEIPYLSLQHEIQKVEQIQT